MHAEEDLSTKGRSKKKQTRENNKNKILLKELENIGKQNGE